MSELTTAKAEVAELLRKLKREARERGCFTPDDHLCFVHLELQLDGPQPQFVLHANAHNEHPACAEWGASFVQPLWDGEDLDWVASELLWDALDRRRALTGEQLTLEV